MFIMMANRKRGAINIPVELVTDERIITKEEMARRNIVRCPPVPVKARKNNKPFDSKPKPVCYKEPVYLSTMYNPSLNLSYFDQLFIRYGKFGEGSFGQVYKVRSREDNKFYAVKRMKQNVSMKDSYAEVRNNEKIDIHPNCVQYFMAWKEEDDVFIKLESCDMSLADFSKRNHNIQEEMLWYVLYDICKALDFLHKKNFLHLDVKPGNIMTKNGYYKLGDFGLLVDLTLASKNAKTLSDGDSKYLALEVLDGIYTPSCDIFGLGITLLELAADLELPEDGKLWQQLRYNFLPTSFYKRATLGFQIVIEKMLSHMYAQRPSAQSILNYRSLKDIKKRDMKFPRTNFAEHFLVKDDNDIIDVMELFNSSVLNNNFNKKPSNNNGDGDAVKQSMESENAPDDNLTGVFPLPVFSGRKALKFSSGDSAMNTPVSNRTSSPNLIPLEFDQTFMDLDIDPEMAEPMCVDIISEPLKTPVSFKDVTEDSGIFSATPVVKTRPSRGIRNLSKSKLHF